MLQYCVHEKKRATLGIVMMLICLAELCCIGLPLRWQRSAETRHVVYYISVIC